MLWKPENAKFKDKQMEKIERNTNQMPIQVVKRTIQELSPIHRVFLPRKDNMTRAVANKKRSILGLPAAPKDFHFDIPEGLRTFSNGDLFVLHDTGKEDRKSSAIRLSGRLSNVQAIYGDETYDRCPLRHQASYRKNKFAQCYVLMFERESTLRRRIPQAADGMPPVPRASAGQTMELNRAHYPLIHALPTTRRPTAVLRHRQAGLPRPTRFKSDYERAVITAVKAAYPGIKCEGDSSHFVQAGLIGAYWLLNWEGTKCCGDELRWGRIFKKTK